MEKQKDLYKIEIDWPDKGVLINVGGKDDNRSFMVSLYAELANNYARPKKIIFKRFPSGKGEGNLVELSDVEKELLTYETKSKLPL